MEGYLPAATFFSSAWNSSRIALALTPFALAFLIQSSMIGADSLRYLSFDSIARSVGLPGDKLCQACLNASYPTEAGKQLYQLQVGCSGTPSGGRAYDK